jgi:hypothetical protein
MAALAAPIQTYGKEFRSKEHGYLLTLPNGWTRIPKNALKQMQDATFNQSGKAVVNYIAGFQADGDAAWFTYPYVLIQVIPYSQCGLDGEPAEELFPDLIKAMTGLDAQKLVDDHISEDARKMVKTPQLGAPVLDADGRRFLWSMDARVTGIGAVQGDVVGLFGRYGIVQVMFYDRKLRWKDSATARAMLWNSLTLNEVHAYDPNAVVVRKSFSPLKKLVMGSILGGIGAGALAAVLALWKLRRKRRDGHALVGGISGPNEVVSGETPPS